MIHKLFLCSYKLKWIIVIRRVNFKQTRNNDISRGNFNSEIQRIPEDGNPYSHCEMSIDGNTG